MDGGQIPRKKVLCNTWMAPKGPATRNDFANDIVNDANVDDGI